MTDTKNLYQRVQAVAQQVGKVEADVRKGEKDQYGKPALTIGSVEDVLRDALAEAGIITRWAVIGAEPVDSKPAGWRVVMHCTFVNVDNPSDLFEDEVTDTGGNISAAGSFAVKAYYRRLFHLSVEDDDTPRQQKTEQRHDQRQSTPPPNGRRVDQNTGEILEPDNSFDGAGIHDQNQDPSPTLTLAKDELKKALSGYEAFHHVGRKDAYQAVFAQIRVPEKASDWTVQHYTALTIWLNSASRPEPAQEPERMVQEV